MSTVGDNTHALLSMGCWLRVCRLTCSLANGKSLLGGLLLGDSHGGLVSSGNILGLLGHVELDVAVGRKIWRDTTMGSVGSSSAADGSLGDDVRDDTLFWVEGLGGRVRLQVVEKVEHVLARLLWPPTVVVTDILAHSLAANTSGVNSEGNDALVSEHVLHVLDGLQQVQSLAGSRSLISVLVVGSQVIDSALSRCKNKTSISNSQPSIRQQPPVLNEINSKLYYHQLLNNLKIISLSASKKHSNLLKLFRAPEMHEIDIGARSIHTQKILKPSRNNTKQSTSTQMTVNILYNPQSSYNLAHIIA